MLLLLSFAFLSGLVTILTPCIWPLLPIILSSSINHRSHKRPLGITMGIVLSFSLLTLFISYVVRIFNFDPNILRLIAVIVISFLGFTLLIPKLSEVFEGALSRLSSLWGNRGQSQKDGFWAGFTTGLALGIVWSPCAGPILAAIAALAATGNVNSTVVYITLAYSLGVGIVLFIFAYGSQKVLNKIGLLTGLTPTIQRIFGVIMILTAIAIYTNYDIYLQSQILNKFPALSKLSSLDNAELTKELDKLKGANSIYQNFNLSDSLFNTNVVSPEITGGTSWLNSQKPLTVSGLKGKVVLVDFWTYTCINCIRTLPHITSWYEKYKNDGFVVIGVHTPEFQFEHDTGNVLAAIKQYGINYPVAQDNNYAIWNNFSNQYWPAEYLIDAKGNIRRFHFGEGEYDQMEEAIQALLRENGRQINAKLDSVADQTPKTSISPETYLGADRMQYYYPTGNTGEVSKIFTLSENIPVNSFSIGGNWRINNEEAVTGDNAVLTYNFYANKVFLVLKPGLAKKSMVKVFLDGNLIPNSMSGTDVKNGIVNLDRDRLYNLVDLHGKSGNHILRLEIDKEVQLFAFTFG